MTICCNLACFQCMFAFFNCCAYSYLLFGYILRLLAERWYSNCCNLTSSTYVHGQNGILLNGHYGGRSHGQVMYLEARLDVGDVGFESILDDPGV